MLDLDAHILLFAVTGSLRKTEEKPLREHSWSISASVLWEIAKLTQLGRISLDLDDPAVARVVGSIHLWPLSAEIAKISTRLDVQGDPADELIAAASLVPYVPLLTGDRALRRSQPVPLA